jgi:hypothetical protein
MEAENAQMGLRSDTLFWMPDTATAGYAGAGYACTYNNTTSTWANGAELAWTVQIHTPGSYCMAIRRVAPDPTSDAPLVGVDGTQGTTFISGQVTQWTWKRDTTYSLGNLSVGRHVILIRRGEDGLQIDRVVIADSLSKLPQENTDIGPAESEHGGPSVTWATAPYAMGSSSVFMMADVASGLASPVEYYFECVTQSHNSGWIAARTWTDTGLNSNTLYEYRVKARCGSIQTGWSAKQPVRTLAAPGDVPEGAAQSVSGEMGNDLGLTVDPHTGAARYSIPIIVPPGRQGSEPKLALQYGGVATSWCGVGWSIGMGAISRDTRRGSPVARGASGQFINEYDDSKGFVASFGNVNTRLVLIADHGTYREYRAETDQAFLKFVYTPSFHFPKWVATDTNGNKFYFGLVSAEDSNMAGAEIKHNSFSQAYGKGTYAWALGKIQDINGNITCAYYSSDQGQTHLDEVRYNGHTASIATTSSVKFELEDANRPDKSWSYATGFLTEMRRRLSDIVVRVHVSGPGTGTWVQARRYHLGYQQSPSTGRSLLSSVTLFGADDVSHLPAVQFTYTEKPMTFDSPIDWGPVKDPSQGNTDLYWNSPSAFVEDARGNVYYQVELFDINGDGLPDRVMRRKTGGSSTSDNTFRVQFNTGSGFTPDLYDWGPTDMLGSADQWTNGTSAKSVVAWSLGTPRLLTTTWIDMDGDGLPDRLMHRNTNPRTGTGYSSYSPDDSSNYLLFQKNTGSGFKRSTPGAS